MEIDILLKYSERGQLRQWLEESHTMAHLTPAQEQPLYRNEPC